MEGKLIFSGTEHPLRAFFCCVQTIKIKIQLKSNNNDVDVYVGDDAIQLRDEKEQKIFLNPRELSRWAPGVDFITENSTVSATKEQH
jgi:hypothetical protein